MDAASGTGGSPAASMIIKGEYDRYLQAEAEAQRIAAEAERAAAEATRRAQLEQEREDAEDSKVAKADALQTANDVVMKDALKYSTEFAKVCQKPGASDQKNRLEQTCRDLSIACAAKLGGHEPRNPTFGFNPKTEKTKYVRRIRKEANASIGPTSAVLEAIAAETGCRIEDGPDKNDERLFQKGSRCYGGDLSRVTDYKRKALIAESFGSIEAAIKEINMQLEVIRIKNRFDKANKNATATGGYRDVQLLVRIKGTDLLLEVQLHIREIYDLKTRVATTKDAEGRTGHERYIEFRNIKEAAELL